MAVVTRRVVVVRHQSMSVFTALALTMIACVIDDHPWATAAFGLACVLLWACYLAAKRKANP